MDKSKGISLIILFIILGLAIIIRLPPIIQYNFPLTFDHGINLLEVRDMVELQKFRLLGPEGGIKGIFFGPAWYYLLAIPFTLFNGDPRSAALLSLIFNLACIPLAWFIGNKINLKTGVVFSLFFTFSSVMIQRASTGFVVDTFPFINLLALWLLTHYSRNSSRQARTIDFAIILLASLSFHFEPVVAAGFNLAVFFILYPRIKILPIQDKLLLVLAWVIPFIPQMLFDLRHNFLQASSIIAALAKGGQDLGGALPLGMRVFDRPAVLFNQFHQFIGNGKLWWTFVLLIYFTIGIKSSLGSKNQYLKLLAKYSLVLFIIPLLYYIFLFPPGIKGWYYLSFIATFGIFISLGISYNLKNRIFRYLSPAVFVIFLFININPYDAIKGIINPPRSDDPSSAQNELAAIEWIYKDAKGSPFAVYTYSPAVYDYPYQYLIWWYARKNNLAFPKDFSYRPKTTDYVPNKLSYVPPPETDENFTTYLIIPTNDIPRQFWTISDFLQPFVNIPAVEEKILEGGIKIQKLSLRSRVYRGRSNL